ncbi:MAG: hypothetical protein HQK79_16255 [Desulfobacterales bacterium]|nr:hypothetical protein [Desulfobacterales bacterium]
MASSNEFEREIECFKEIINFNPGDKAASRYLQRANHFRKYGLPAEWDGTEVMDNK